MTIRSRPLLSYYGDDFTGSTDVMEALSSNGIDTLLFLRTPSVTEVASARESYAAIGIAGISRSKDVRWQDQHLPQVFERLKAIDADVCHYKVCSTFDSSPAIGNIGRAIEIGRSVFSQAGATPLVIGAPALRRYTAFGHLFASVGDQHYRIDSHPTMSVHPSTPMDESDMRLHLGRQTTLSIGLFDLIAQQQPAAAQQLDQLLTAHDVLLFDVMDEASQARVGGFLWQRANRTDGSLFCVGSSGVESALVAHWRATGGVDVEPVTRSAEPARQIIVVSGSCSPVTAMQIDDAENDGFCCLRADPVRLLTETSREAEMERLRREARQALQQGASVLLYTARGPCDPSLERVASLIREQGMEQSAALASMGHAMGAVLRDLMEQTGVRRIAVAGGDTSGQVVSALNLSALKMRATLAPGVPLCSGYTDIDQEPAIEIALKGGQVGDKRFFSSVRAGRALH
jgi:uncharacterized protein YgbK (DUF1537 family)